MQFNVKSVKEKEKISATQQNPVFFFKVPNTNKCYKSPFFYGRTKGHFHSPRLFEGSDKSLRSRFFILLSRLLTFIPLFNTVCEPWSTSLIHSWTKYEVDGGRGGRSKSDQRPKKLLYTWSHMFERLDRKRKKNKVRKGKPIVIESVLSF